MARMPDAEWMGPHHDNGLMSRYDVVCLHTIVGNPPAHAAHFSTRSDGHIYQSRDTQFASAANYQGNHRVIAIENDDTGEPFPNWDHNDGHQVPEFTPSQVEACARVCAWAYQVHGIPLEQCPDSRPGSRGIAYHRQGIDGNFYGEGYAFGGRVPGGEIWTKYAGKACPGDARISQVPAIIHRARVIAGLDNEDLVPIEEESSMYILQGGTGLTDCNVYLLSGPFFVGLSGGERSDAVDAINKRGAAYQWVQAETVTALDKRSHALYDNGKVIDLLTQILNKGV